MILSPAGGFNPDVEPLPVLIRTAPFVEAGCDDETVCVFTYRYVHTRHDLVTAEGIVLLIHLILVASVVALEHARGSASRSHLQLRVAETSPEYVQVQTMCKSWGSTPQCLSLIHI